MNLFQATHALLLLIGELSAYLLGALIFLAVGLIELAFLYRVVYPQLRWRYEKAKSTQSQGIDPNRIMTLFKVQSLIVLPALGLFLGEPIRQFVENRP